MKRLRCACVVEQMYQALRSLGVDTQLVIYLNEFQRHHAPELRPRPLRALPGLVRQVREEVGAGLGHDRDALEFLDGLFGERQQGRGGGSKLFEAEAARAGRIYIRDEVGPAAATRWGRPQLL